ncbi:hypothetical protein PYW07_012995 [Mythimna separata]|uniref:MADF domain-containing protein n=1 Tax=Mythimna separata TaxID=271217 RepID=A0AAD7Y984_MYTSE|nr:hypothetical protein PYW07_012995 [Mythimna separata]
MDFNTQLIELVKSRRFLYDMNDPHHSDQALRDNAWKEIAAQLKAQKSEVKKSWILLREGYRRNLKKQIASKMDPIHRKDKAVQKWTYEDDLSFLSPHFKIRALTLSNAYSDVNVEENSNNVDNQTNTEQRRPAKRSRTHESTKRTCANETYSNTLIKYILDKTSKKDNIQHFFESISSTVQTFPLRDRAIAKARVFEIISQMELEILSRDATPSFQYGSSPVSYEAEVKPQEHRFVCPSPETQSPSLLEVNDSSDDESPVLDIKIEEPEPVIGIQFEPDS